MAIQGTNGTGNQFSDRFASGDVISASQLNDLINGISTALPQPYIGAGPNISFGSGGTVITTAETDTPTEFNFSLSLAFGGEKVNHWEIAVVGFDAGSGTLGFAMKVAKGGNIWRPLGSDCDDELRADVITTDGTLTVVPGTNPASPWASLDGHIVIAPESIYYAYAYKVEKSTGETAFYIYVSQDGTLANYCPVTLPTGITPPSGDYTAQVLLVGSVAWVTYTTPPSFVVDQQIIGSITWPGAGGGGPASEYINQFELKVVDEDIEGTLVPVLKVASGAHIYRPVGSDCDKSEYTEDLTPDPSGPSPVVVVPGLGSSRPWASSDGYVEISGGDYYVYAFKVETSSAAQFYIYVSKSSTLVDSCPVSLPAGITPPTGDYTVQGLKIGSASYDGEIWSVEQNIVGSITWPSDAPYVKPDQFEVRVSTIEGAPIVRIARGNVVAHTQSISSFSPPAYSQENGEPVVVESRPFEVKNVAVYPVGSYVAGSDPNSEWANDNGRIDIPAGATNVGVYVIRNTNNLGHFAGGSNLYIGYPYLAVMAQGSDAEVKTRPFGTSPSWFSLWVYSTMQVSIDSTSFDINGEENSYLHYGIDYWVNALLSWNCQRYKIADVVYNSTTLQWEVVQHMKGPLTMPLPYNYGGVNRVKFDPTGHNIGYPSWFDKPDKETEQIAWWASYSGYTKWDGSGAAPTIVVPT